MLCAFSKYAVIDATLNNPVSLARTKVAAKKAAKINTTLSNGATILLPFSRSFRRWQGLTCLTISGASPYQY